MGSPLRSAASPKKENMTLKGVRMETQREINLSLFFLSLFFLFAFFYRGTITGRLCRNGLALDAVIQPRLYSSGILLPLRVSVSLAVSFNCGTEC